MRNTGERAALILRRTQALRKKREKRVNAALSALCGTLCVCLAGLFRIFTDGGGAGYVPGLYGSALLYGDAGGYVLAGVIAFMAGVIVTVLCVRHRHSGSDHGKEGSEKDERNDI